MTITATLDFWKLFRGKKEILLPGSTHIIENKWDKKSQTGVITALNVLTEDSIALGRGESKSAMTPWGPGSGGKVDEWGEPIVGEEINKANVRLKDFYGLGVTNRIRWEPTLPPQAKR